MIPRDKDYSEFDERVEKFLKNQMTIDEANFFKSELKDDLDKMKRAQSMALLIKELNVLRQEEEVAFISTLKRVSLEEYMDISENVNYTHFDDDVTRFLKKQMNETEEADFRTKLKESKVLENRAKTIALTIKEMNSINKEQEAVFIEKISKLDEDQFRRKLGLPTKVIHFPAFIRHYAAAACIVGFVLLGIDYIQSDAYESTISVGNKYCTQVSTVYRADLDQETSQNLENLFASVNSSDTINEKTISALLQMYNKSADESDELNYYRIDIAWNLSMAYLKAGNRKAAKPILEDILENSDVGRPLHDSAEKVLNEINSIFSLW